ncbi:MAG: carboxyl transferase domain-containing protein [Acidimicrobiales bacterium]
MGSSSEYVITAEFAATVVRVDVAPGQVVEAGGSVLVLEAMKMEHVITAPVSGVATGLTVAIGDTVAPGQSLLAVVEGDAPQDAGPEGAPGGVGDEERPDLAALIERKRILDDEARPEAVAKRHALGRRTARENLADLCDPDSFEEYGGFVLAAQRARRDKEELVQRTSADGVIAGLARIGGHRCAVVSYDYMVMAGTQGLAGHHKQDRFFELIKKLRLPVVLFAEGGGGRPGDTDYPVVSGNTVKSFALFAELSGLVPTVGIGSGRCFAGNAALLGCCDVVIATPEANIGMGGPAMIEGGGLGSFRPEDVGPVDVQSPNGVIDLLAADDADAVVLAKRYLGYFHGAVDGWDCADQSALRHVVPVNRKRVYDTDRVIALLADTDSTTALRSAYGIGITTILARIEGRPVGLIVNNPKYLGGAIDADAADKASRFMQLCDAHELPIVFLCDTPGFMVGPEAEQTAQVRRFSRMFVTGASLTVPVITIILRKAYGLGALGMAAGGFHSPLLTAAWPTGELGGMNIEGAVRLGSRRELDAIADPDERERLFEEKVAQVYERSRAMDAAEIFELDDVIDPADTRHRIVNTLRSCPEPPPRTGKKRPMIDTW